MNKPGDFFVGIVDLFAVLLPGGLLAFVLFQFYGAFFLDVVAIADEHFTIALVFFAYLLGHLVFMVGSWLDRVYDVHRKLKNPYTNESAYQCASRIKARLHTEPECKAVNNYQWAISVLTTQYGDAMTEINRLVAVSKFFRSIVVIIPLLALVLWLNGKALHALVALVFLLPCYYRYYGQRLKSTTRAYQYVVTLHGLGRLTAAQPQTNTGESSD